MKSLKEKSYSITYYKILMLLLWTDSIILDYVRAIIMRIPVIGTQDDEITFAVIAFFAVFSMSVLVSGLRWGDIVFVGIAVFTFIITASVSEWNDDALSAIGFVPYLTAVSLYFIGASFNEGEEKEMYRLLYYASIISVIMFSVYNLFIGTLDAESIQTGAMGIAYFSLPHMCLILYYCINRPNILNIAVFVLGVVVLTSLGTRGPLLCLLVFAILCVLFLSKAKRAGLKCVIMGTVYLIFTYTKLLYNVVMQLRKFSASFGLSTRIYDKYLYNEMAEESGRDLLRQKLFDAINDRPLGYGLGGDRGIINAYSHNIALELVVDFGLIIGIVMFVLIVCLIIRAFIHTGGQKEKRMMVILLFCCGFVKLLVSGSFMTEPFFWMLLGICVKVCREYRERAQISVVPAVIQPQPGQEQQNK